SKTSVVPTTDIIETLNEVSNLSIDQEIVISQDLSVEKDLAQESMDTKFVEQMCEAFWDHLKEQLSNTPPDFSCVLELLINIKHILITLLLPRQTGLRNEIEETLNMDLLKQETEHGTLDFPLLSTNILHVMALLCVPFRDEAVQNLESIKDPVELLRGIFQVLILMKRDMANYTIRNVQPYLQEHSFQDERDEFQKLLNKQPNLLKRTTKWITRAATDLITRMRASNAPSTSLSMALSFPVTEVNPEPPSLTMVLYQGYLNLVLRDHGNEEFPETLMMDRARLQIMKAKLYDLTILASVLLVAKSFSYGVLFSSPKFVEKLKCITMALTEDFIIEPEEVMRRVSEQVSEEIHQGLKDKGLKALSRKNRASLVGQLQNIAKKENDVRIIIEQRIHLFLKRCLVRGMQESLINSAGGLLFIEAELAELGWKFVNLMHHNQDVFSPYYADILKDVLSSPNLEENDMPVK
uniref:T-complex 11 family, X-linked 2 n=1 Tax=Jaculus jaculus TaxID=51337 RepID=A0A8C5JXP0_JACJA